MVWTNVVGSKASPFTQKLDPEQTSAPTEKIVEHEQPPEAGVFVKS